MEERKREMRFLQAAELRAMDSGQIMGYAAVFNQPADSGMGFIEVVRPGAFAKTIADGADVRALWNHDPNHVLGRTKAGTLKLSEDEHGLMVDITPPDTQLARDLRTSIKRGDVSQMSFAFQVVRESWAKDGDQNVRELQEVKLFDVSPVTYPFYEGTSVQARTQEAAPAEIPPVDEAAIRERELELLAAEAAVQEQIARG